MSNSALERLNEAVHAISRYTELDPALKQQCDSLEATVRGLEEAAREIHAYGDRLEYDPARLEEIESRLELIRNLKRKYGQTIPEIPSYLKKAEQELAGITHSEARRAELEQTCRTIKLEMGEIAAELSQTRIRAARKLVTAAKKELKDLNLARVDFTVSITQEPAPDGIPLPDGKSYAFHKWGVDNVEFLASTNPGEPLKPLAKIASTGEISRFMLALKGALSEADHTPVLIFDEIDIGVGGRSGEILGKKLWRLARNRQVVCVTHLPQIAVFADAHYAVRKETIRSRTLSRIERLTGKARLQELATMLAGPNYTETALNNARELLGKAKAWQEELGEKVSATLKSNTPFL